MSVAAVITAGGRVGDEFADAIGTEIKALARIGNSSLLEKAISALRECGIERIAVVGGPEVRAACDREIAVIEETPDGAENARRALHSWDERETLLYLTSDMPFITGSALRAFLECVPPQTLALPLTEWRDFAARFPDAPPFGITLAGERVVNGGAFLVPAPAKTRVEALAMQLFNARKEPWRMARIAGPRLLLRFAFKRLDVKSLEARARGLIGANALAVRGAPAELAYDVDTLAEYRYACAQA
jgi:hypothetical protein